MKCMYIVQSKFPTLLPIKNKTNDNKHVICHLQSMQLQNMGNLFQNSPAVKKPSEKDVKSKVAGKKWLWW